MCKSFRTYPSFASSLFLVICKDMIKSLKASKSLMDTIELSKFGAFYQSIFFLPFFIHYAVSG